jgi:hypothetical protein
MGVPKEAADTAWGTATLSEQRTKRHGRERGDQASSGAERRILMWGNRYALALVVGATLGLGGMMSGSPTLAADLPVKAPPPPPTPEFDIHGFFDISFKNDYITPRGLLVTNTGLTTQILSGMALDLYKSKTGFINDVSVYGGVWNDLWSKQSDPFVGSWNEFDWFVGVNVKFWQDWKFGVEYIEFLSPPHNFHTERHFQFTLGYDDSKWNPFIPFNPYVRLWYETSGDSNVVVGKKGDTYYVEFGVTPTLDLNKYGWPVVLTAPTWVSVGPSEYWNRGVTGCGALATTPCSLDNAGVFSSGLTATVPLKFVPTRLGNWYVKGGFQYYYLINDSLLLAQTFTGTAATYLTAHRDVWVGFGGVGFAF